LGREHVSRQLFAPLKEMGLRARARESCHQL
jgi:hypothetical protein